MPSYVILGSMVFELHDMLIVCLLKAVTPAWVRNTVSFTLQIDYIHHSGSFEVFQAKIAFLQFSVKGYNNNRIHDSARCVRRNSILLKLQLQPKSQVPDLSVNLFYWRQLKLEVSLVSARLNLLLVLLLACRETRVLIRTSILPPRDST